LSDFISFFFFDHFAAIREQTWNNFIILNETVGYDKIKPIIEKGLNDLINHGNYIFRVTAL